MFNHFKIFTVRSSFMAQKPGILPPYLGSTVRGILGHCIRESVCSFMTKKCFLCNKREECLYVRYFSNTGKESGAVNPFAVHVLKDGQVDWKAGDVYVFALTLFGFAAEAADIYLNALLAMEKKGWGAYRIPFQLLRLSDVKTSRLIYTKDMVWKNNWMPYSIQVMTQEAKTVFVSFETPLRIVSGKELCLIPSFATLIRFICGRLSLLSKIYTGTAIDWDSKLQMNAEEIRITEHGMRQVDFQRYSINQKDNKLELPAVDGYIVYKGELQPLIPILEAGKYVHVGKGVTIGFGYYETFYDL